MNDTLKNNYILDVGVNMVKGFLVFGGLSTCLGILMLVALFFFDGPINSHTKQQKEWCERYHPTLSFSDCSVEAGW